MAINRASFRFYAELNSFLPRHKRQVTFAHPFKDRASIKDLIEAQGVPHTEVDLILVRGEPVNFSYLVRDGDRISVYPIFRSIDIAPPVRLQPQPPGEPGFVLDTHLGRLAAYLRMLGFDTLYRNDYADDELARISHDEQRVLLTRDRGLLKRSAITYGYYVRETDPPQQVVEVLRRFGLFGAIAPFRRCIHCNGITRPVPKQAIDARLPPRTRDYYDEFHVCQACDRIYWKGTHYQRMQRFIAGVLQHDPAR